MFEQSILLDQPAGKRAGALAASLTAQLACVCVLVLIPLIYNDRLPDIRAWTAFTLPLAPLQPEAPPVQQAQPLRTPVRIPPRVLQLPSREPQPAAPSFASWGQPTVGAAALP